MHPPYHIIYNKPSCSTQQCCCQSSCMNNPFSLLIWSNYHDTETRSNVRLSSCCNRYRSSSNQVVEGHKVKSQYVQIQNIVDISLKRQISDQSTSMLKCCMYIMFYMVSTPFINAFMEEHWSSANSSAIFSRRKKYSPCDLICTYCVFILRDSNINY